MASLPEDSSYQPSEVYTTSRFNRKKLILILVVLIGIAALVITFKSSIYKNPFSKPSSTPPAAQKPGSCLVLPEQYCSQGEVIYTKNSVGGSEIYVGFKLPAGVPIFAGQDGQVTKVKYAQPSQFHGFRASVADPDLTKPTGMAFGIIGDLAFDNMLSLNVKKGTIIGRTADSGTNNLGGYNILVTVRERGQTNKKVLQSIFPKLNYAK